MRKIFFTLIFFLFTPLTLSISLFGLFEASQTKNLSTLVKQETKTVLGARTPLELYSSLPAAVGSINTAITTGDARPVIIKQYLEEYGSPMAPYADLIFQISDEYGLDYRLMIAIAQCESNLCRKSPPDSYNCWGFENGETRFLSWEQAIRQVAKTLKEDYYDEGLITPEEIMPKYAPPSVEKGGPWAKCVNQFFEELE